MPIALALLLAACGDALEDDEPEIATPAATATTPASSTPSPTPDADTSVPPISAWEFCQQAVLTITRWDLPPTLGDGIQRGTIELRYRLPPGAEPLVLWLGATIEVGDVTFGDLFALDPTLHSLFPNADPAATFPTTIPSHGFDLEEDSQLHTIEVAITLPSEAMFDTAEPWQWSSLSPPPFLIGEPWLVATFRADGTRVRLDGEHCTPIILPLP